MATRSDYEIVLPEQSLPTGRMVGLGLQHVIAMFGATVLAPLLMGFDPNLAIFFSGIGTLIFMFLVRGRIPSYLGSSFAFIGPVIAARATAESSVVSLKYSRALFWPTDLPSTTIWAPVEVTGFISTGPMSTWGSRPQARAWRIWARGISRPSPVTPAWLAMFWALKGATSSPASRNSRQSPAATKLLPTSDPLPSTATAFPMAP